MLNCSKLQGEFTKKITVETNDPENPHVYLTCKGKLLESLKLEPNMVNFGRVLYGEKTVERTVRITRGDAGPLTLELQPMKEAGIETELREVEPGERYDLFVRAHPKPGEQRINGRITLNTGVPEQETVQINVFGTVMPRVMAHPANVFVPSTADANWNQPITVRWTNDTSGHKIVGAQVNHPKLGVTVEDGEPSAEQSTPSTGQPPGPRVILTLKEPIEGPLPADVQVTIETDDPEAGTISVPVRYRPVRPQRPLATKPGNRPAVRSKQGKPHASAAEMAKRRETAQGAQEAQPASESAPAPESVPAPESKPAPASPPAPEPTPASAPAATPAP